MTASLRCCLSAVMRHGRYVGWSSVGVLWLAGCTATTQPATVATLAPPTASEAAAVRLAETRLQLAGLYYQDGQHQVALSEVARALQANPRYLDAYNLQGWVHLALKDFAQADASFAKARALQPDDPNTQYNQAWSWCQQRQFAKASAGFDAVLHSARPADEVRPRALLAKGVCLRDAGDKAASAEALMQAFEADPGNPVAALHYAQSLYEQGQSERARFYIRRLNNSEHASAASLWLGVKVERVLGDTVAMRQLSDQLNRRFPDSRETHRLERGAFDE